MSKFDWERFDAESTKVYGEEAVKALDAQTKIGAPGTFIPSSSEALNKAIGVGGLPKGRVVEIKGPESGGKTTLALDFIANEQRQNKDAFTFYADAENALNPKYAKALGVDTSKERFRISQTNELEEAANLTLKAAKFGASLVIVDSLPTLEYAKQLDDDEATASRAGGTAKPLKDWLKRMVKTCAESGTTVILINHITYKVGVSYGNPETTPGGGGPRYYASIRLDVRPFEKIVDKTTGEVFGTKTRVKVIKNKVGTPFKEAEFDLIYGEGIDRFADLTAVATEVGVIKKSGNWLQYGETLKVNGQKALTDALRADPKMEAKIRTETQKALRAA